MVRSGQSVRDDYRVSFYFEESLKISKSIHGIRYLLYVLCLDQYDVIG